MSECILAKRSGECVKVDEGSEGARGEEGSPREMDRNGSEFAEPTRNFIYYFIYFS